MKIIYHSPESGKEFQDYFQFRWKLLRKPLDLPRGSEQDELEDRAFHIAAYNDRAIIGVGRVHIEPDHSARIRYMAVDEGYQNQSIGSSILRELEQIARINKVRNCWLYAREDAINFYLKNGYRIKGKASSALKEVPHVKMEKSLI